MLEELIMYITTFFNGLWSQGPSKMSRNCFSKNHYQAYKLDQKLLLEILKFSRSFIGKLGKSREVNVCFC